MKYGTIKLLVLLLLFSYFVIGMKSAYGPERYPVFSWQLFSVIPNPSYKYHISVSSFGDETYEPALKFFDTDFIFKAINASPTEYTPIIHQLGTALEANKQLRADEYSEYLEKIFRGLPYEYSLLKVYYDPVEYWKTRNYISEEVLHVYKNK